MYSIYGIHTACLYQHVRSRNTLPYCRLYNVYRILGLGSRQCAPSYTLVSKVPTNLHFVSLREALKCLYVSCSGSLGPRSEGSVDIILPTDN